MRYLDFVEKAKFNEKYVIPAFEKIHDQKRADKINGCGLYKHFAMCDDCLSIHYNGAFVCKDRFCAVCQKKRSLLWLTKMKPIFDHYLDNKQKIVFVTFTIKDTEKLKPGIEQIQNAFRYMTAKWKQSVKEFKLRFSGGVRSLEVKRGANSGLWHPHLHCLFVKRSNTLFKEDFEYLKNVWEHSCRVVTGTTDPNAKLGSVDYRAIKATTYQDGITAILETFKYTTKFEWDDTDDILELVESLKRVRTINTFGGVRKLLSESDIEKDMDKPLTEIANRVCSICGGYHFTEFSSADFKGLHLCIHDFAEDLIPVEAIEYTHDIERAPTMNDRLQEHERKQFTQDMHIITRNKWLKDHNLNLAPVDNDIMDIFDWEDKPEYKMKIGEL